MQLNSGSDGYICVRFLWVVGTLIGLRELPGFRGLMDRGEGTPCEQTSILRGRRKSGGVGERGCQRSDI